MRASAWAAVVGAGVTAWTAVVGLAVAFYTAGPVMTVWLSWSLSCGLALVLGGLVWAHLEQRPRR